MEASPSQEASPMETSVDKHGGHPLSSQSHSFRAPFLLLNGTLSETK